MKTILPFLAVCTLAMPVHAFELAMPVDCAMDEQCVVQNFVDHDAADGDKAYRDHTCGPLSYDGHKGTDIRALNMAIMQKGVPVLAAASGKVLGLRDGVADGAPATPKMECGNGVRISHADGWITQYCHLKKDSVQVEKGETVKVGQQLGEIGMSGAATFPHVHVQVEKDGNFIDPYTGTQMNTACDTSGEPLWTAEAASQLAYRATGLLGGGFADHKPEKDEMQSGTYAVKQLSGDEPVLIFWVELFGVREGDEAYLSMKDPQGMVLAETRNTLDRNRAVQSYYIGKIQRQGKWEPGNYTGLLRLKRGDDAVIEQEFSVEIGS